MKEQRERRSAQTSFALRVMPLSLFVRNGEAPDHRIQITVELSSDESELPQLADISAELDTDQDCACE